MRYNDMTGEDRPMGPGGFRDAAMYDGEGDLRRSGGHRRRGHHGFGRHVDGCTPGGGGERDGFPPRGRGPRGGRGRGGRGGFGFGPEFGGFGPGFGPGGGFGPRGGRGRGRARRGEVRNAVLALLSDGQANGYSLMKSIEERTGGVWRVSPGSMYPTLAQLVDEGLIAPADGATGGGTEYRLTEMGGTWVAEHSDALEQVWNPAQEQWAEVGDLMTAIGKFMQAARQVGMSGTTQQRKQAAEKIDELRREFYRMLGE